MRLTVRFTGKTGIGWNTVLMGCLQHPLFAALFRETFIVLSFYIAFISWICYNKREKQRDLGFTNGEIHMFLWGAEGRLDLKYQNQSFLQGITVVVHTAGGKDYVPELTKITEKQAFFSHDAVHAVLTVREQDGLLSLHLSGTLIRDRSKQQFFDKAESNIDPVRGVSVQIKGLANIKQYNSLYLTTFWNSCGVFGTDLSKILPQTQTVTLQYETDYGFLLSVCDEQYKSQFSGCASGGFEVSLCSYKRGMKEFSGLLFTYARDGNPFVLPERLSAYALKLLHKPGKPAKERQYPEILEYLGWCSWDAFPCHPSHEGLLQKADELIQKGIPVRWALIDDMWQQLDEEDSVERMHDHRLVDLEADKKIFPKGLECAVQDLKAKGLKVGIWHPITGYWHGFDERSRLVRENPDLFCKTEDGRTVIKPTEAAVFQYHAVFYEFLKKSGVDFVKVDNQSSIQWFYSNLGTVGEVAHALHTGIEGAAGAYFDGDMINCMGCAAENLWNRPNSLINRCSNDFLPEDRKWFIQHILQASFCCYSFSGLFQGDYDMFWTDDDQAVKNCVLRAMSGGPVYVSDKLGRSVKERLWPLALADGRIIRCNRSAVPTADCLMDQAASGDKAFKVWNCTENGLVMAAFNLTEQETPVTALLSPNDTKMAAGRYLAYDFFTGHAKLIDANEAIVSTLKTYDDFMFLNFIPLKNGRAVIGLAEKYVTSGTYTEFLPGKFKVKNGGSFLFYSLQKPEKVLLDGKEAIYDEKQHLYTLQIPQVDREHLVELY